MAKTNQDRSDEELMTLYQDGDYLAFECLYQRHSGRVFQYLKTKVSEQAAQDLLQETFAKVHRSRHQYVSQYPFLPWLFTISRNALMDFFKHSETKISRLSLNTAIPESSDSPADFSFQPTSLPEQDLSLALRALPADQRHAIELRYLSDWSFEKIATDMKTTPANSRQLVSRGIKKMRSFFIGGKK